MTIKDVLLTLTSYPEPTPVSVIDDAVALAASFGAHIAAIACEAQRRNSLDLSLQFPR